WYVLPAARDDRTRVVSRLAELDDSRQVAIQTRLPAASGGCGKQTAVLGWPHGQSRQADVADKSLIDDGEEPVNRVGGGVRRRGGQCQRTQAVVVQARGRAA